MYLFDHERLLAELQQRGVKIRIATSVRRDQWARARIFPPWSDACLSLTPEQAALLSLFTDQPTDRSWQS